MRAQVLRFDARLREPQHACRQHRRCTSLKAANRHADTWRPCILNVKEVEGATVEVVVATARRAASRCCAATCLWMQRERAPCSCNLAFDYAPATLSLFDRVPFSANAIARRAEDVRAMFERYGEIRCDGAPAACLAHSSLELNSLPSMFVHAGMSTCPVTTTHSECSSDSRSGSW